MNTDEALMSTREVADYLGVHKRTVERWAKAGKVHPQRLPDGRFRFDKDDVRGLLRPVN